MKTALITGASSGIGEEFARLLAEDGYEVILAARRKDRLSQLAKKLTRNGNGDAKILQADLQTPEGVSAFLEKTRGLKNKLDLLVNNAGFGTHGPFARNNMDRETGMVYLHCTATLQLTHFFLPGMLAKKSGGIINVASTAAFQPVPYMATYAATKVFLLSFSHALAEEVKASGVKVMCLCPGATKTEFQSISSPGSTLKPPRWMTARDVARIALNDFKKGRRVSVPGVENKLIGVLSKVIPLNLTAFVAGAVFKPPDR